MCVVCNVQVQHTDYRRIDNIYNVYIIIMYFIGHKVYIYMLSENM